MPLFNLFSKKSKEKKEQEKEVLNQGLEKTSKSFFSKIGKALAGKSKVDEEVLDNLEEALITSDVGIDTTLKIIDRIEKRVANDKYFGENELNQILKEEISSLLQENTSQDLSKFELPKLDMPYVLLVVGVNGVGKTTTIGKLASQFKAAGKKVVLGAADTFRAAAVDQLKIWGERNDVPVIEHGMNTAPSAVAYDAVKQGIELDADIVIIDTAGRLHNKLNLMKELTGIKKAIQKHVPEAPHEVMLVLDGSTGQNAFIQAKEFSNATDVSSLAITKLDGTAKGGVVLGISDQLQIPVKYIGVGEGIDDLQVFDKTEFVDSLFQQMN
ncbi:MAG: signal recognition particle-docking protein FtsY [Cytophagales bacterium]|nr:signal recognition particle-docking protein FtsY [Cytophagales bacterium]